MPLYTLDSGAPMAITNEFGVKYLPTASTAQIAALAEKTGSTIVRSVGAGLVILSVPKGGNALATANLYQESGLVEFAHPNFLMDFVRHQTAPNDEFYPRQFYLHNTGQVIADGHTGNPGADIKAPEAWGLTLGSANITVAILDDGVSANHPDLPNSRQVRLANSNFSGEGNVNDPSPLGFSAHGNHCAGVVAATQGNGEGISGVAPNCKIMPVRIFNSNPDGGGADVAGLAAAITFAKTNGADIISNSWGFRTVTDPNAVPMIVNAIQDATVNGRGGKGCVVVFSSGNNADHNTGNNGFVAFPASVNIPGVLTVGASDRYDKQANYSATANPASSQNQFIDVVAPSHRAYPTQIAGETFEVWSIDTQQPNGQTGDNPWPNVPNQTVPPQIGEQLPNSGTNFLFYSGRFGGTSAACPQVAGIAALLLSINPSLTQQQVFNLITSTASKVGGYVYANNQSNELGYGRVNAYQAVQQACSTLAAFSGPNQVCYPNVTYQASNSAVSLNWTATPSSLFTVSAGTGNSFTTAASAGAVGRGYITATAPGGCSQVIVTQGVLVGTEPTGKYVAPNSSGTLQTAQFVSAGRIDINLNENYNFIFSANSPNVVVIKKMNNSAYFDLAAGTGVQITATANGSSCAVVGRFTFSAGRSGSSYAVAPNPASTDLTVAAVEEGQRQMAATSASEATPASVPFDADLYDSHGRKVRTNHSSHGKAVLDVRDLPEGLYVLRSGSGKNIYSEHIQITH